MNQTLKEKKNFLAKEKWCALDDYSQWRLAQWNAMQEDTAVYHLQEKAPHNTTWLHSQKLLIILYIIKLYNKK